MPKTRGESIFFTSITAWMMVYVMTLYNTVLATGTFTNLTFFIALKNMWIEYIIIGLLAYFVSSHLAKMCAFRVVQPGDRPIFIIFAIQTFTVIWQVAFASVISVFHGHGFTANFIPDYLTTYCKNFILAFPLQLIFVGPLAIFIFRMLFISRKKEIWLRYKMTMSRSSMKSCNHTVNERNLLSTPWKSPESVRSDPTPLPLSGWNAFFHPHSKQPHISFPFHPLPVSSDNTISYFSRPSDP